MIILNHNLKSPGLRGAADSNCSGIENGESRLACHMKIADPLKGVAVAVGQRICCSLKICSNYPRAERVLGQIIAEATVVGVGGN